MDKNGGNSQIFSIEQAMAFAASPAGQQLIRILQQKGGTDLSKAKSLASGGDMEGAKNALSAILSDPQVQMLMKELGG